MEPVHRKLIPAAAVATCAAAVLALFAGPVNADDAPGPVPTASPTSGPSVSPTRIPSVPPTTGPTVMPTAAPTAIPSSTPAPGGSPTTGPTGGVTPAPGCTQPVPQLPTPESVPGYGTVTLGMCATDHRTGRGKLVFTSSSDSNDPITYRVTLRWTYEGKPEAGCEACWSSARYDYTEDVYVNDAVYAERLTVPFVIQHRGELIGEQRPGTGVTVVDIQPMEPAWQGNPAFVGPVPGATRPTQSS
ncbi:hypothetical protein ACFZBM_30905 [Streptomyces lavendulae]|uniref:Uncharacterized protein n=1 Tax=Streptomyces lavendulae subsp. lavendulae TaxID=58340 RepID=A0A2K8PRI0_STRLA|nr:hypothetical protein [Streptomyces lavendulae]ATZ29351.1 hypothetical protein SLAV_37935 [Streptomyces lavendulae subsp. lavendulae]QUQ59161.1 hypothetical protein SLLC_36075 [Streptomyces lavendulae subsp. lavendulae]